MPQIKFMRRPCLRISAALSLSFAPSASDTRGVMAYETPIPKINGSIKIKLPNAQAAKAAVSLINPTMTLSATPVITCPNMESMTGYPNKNPLLKCGRKRENINQQKGKNRSNGIKLNANIIDFILMGNGQWFND